MKVLYQGVFFDPYQAIRLYDRFEKNILRYPPEDPIHVTFQYRPSPNEMFVSELLGQECPLRIIGIGNDGKNAGYRVEIPEQFAHLYKGAPVPHITMSLGAGAKPVATKDLEFQAIEPVDITGRFGLFTDHGVDFGYRQVC